MARLEDEEQVIPLSKYIPPRIGVVTVTYNSANVLPDFFLSISAQSYPKFTVYVVDNVSSDSTLEICRQHSNLPLVVISNAVNVGVAEGNNQGIRAALDAGCEYVLLLNNDTVFASDLLAKLQEGIVEHQCAMTTPKIYFHDAPQTIWAAGGCFQPWLGYRIQHYGFKELDRGQFDQSRRITYAPTCCVLIHKSVFHSIGLMDPLYFVYADDVDFMYRTMKVGFTMRYLPSCAILHKEGSLTGGVSSMFAIRYGTRNRVYFARKHFSSFWAAFWIGLYRVYLFFRYLIRRDTKSIWNLRQNAVIEGMKMGCSI